MGGRGEERVFFDFSKPKRREEENCKETKIFFFARGKDRERTTQQMLGRKWVTTGVRTQVLQQWFSSSRNSKMAERSVRMRNFFDADPVFPGTQYTRERTFQYNLQLTARK